MMSYMYVYINATLRHYFSSRVLKSKIVRDINFIYLFIKNAQWQNANHKQNSTQMPINSN